MADTDESPVDAQRDALLASTSRETPVTARSRVVALILATSAGCLDGFTFIGHGHVFASAMTGNMVLFGIHLAHPGRETLSYMVPMAAFVAGVMLAGWAVREPARRWFWNRPHGVILGLQIATLFALALIPLHLDDRLLVALITIGTAMQNASFRKVGTSSYNSVFMTGNLQSLAGDLDTGAFAAARDIGIAILGFVGGAALGALLTPHAAALTLLVPALLLTVTAILLLVSQDGAG